MLIDTHSHLNFKVFDKDRDEVMSRSLKEGVFMINVGSDYKTSKLAIEIAQKYEKGVYAAVALHPIHINDEKFDYEKYKELVMSSNKVVAIGETGLDAMYPNPLQELVCLEHLRLAKELNLPVILHCRKAHSDLISLLKTSHIPCDRTGCVRFDARGAVHCFTGKWSEAKQYLDMGLYLGFNGIIFKMDLVETIKKMPLEKMLLETDCPYLTPLLAVARSSSGDAKAGLSLRNEPANVKYIAQRIAEIRNEPLDVIAQATTQNAKRLFKI